MSDRTLQLSNTVGRLRLAGTSALAGLALALAAGAPSLAQDGASLPAEAEADVEVQQDAVKALDDMAAHLRTLKQFKLTATGSSEDVLEDGQKIEIMGEAVFQVRTPDRLKIEIDNDKQERDYYYDGKTITQVAPALGYYAVFEAPDTIVKMIGEAQEKYGVEFPLADLFFWGSENAPDVKILAAYFAGQSNILGNKCNHYAYKVEGAQVQVWIRAKGDPLPCRLVLIDTIDPERSQYSATLNWDVDATFNDSVFLYSPNEEMGRVDQDPVSATQP